MSLNYDLTKVYAAHPELNSDEQWDTTQSMIFLTMGVGIGQLTEKNADEFYARQAIQAELFEWTELTPEQIQLYIGLSTNAAFKDESRASWTKRTLTEALNRNARHYAKAVSA